MVGCCCYCFYLKYQTKCLVFSTINSHWQLTGNTLATDKFIRLTSDSQSRVGGLWSTIPVVYPDWEIQVQFKVHGENKNIFADGFAIWYVKTPLKIGPVFGYEDPFSGLGIILDTYANKYSHTVIFDENRKNRIVVLCLFVCSIRFRT